MGAAGSSASGDVPDAGASGTAEGGAGGTTSSGGSSGGIGHGGHAGSTGQAGSVGTAGVVGSGGHAGMSGGGLGGGAGLGGMGGPGGGAASGGSGGVGGAPTCSDLLARANKQLDAARLCDTASKAPQCTGTVATTCGCEVPVEKSDSVDTKAYLATVAQIGQNNCMQKCPLVACAPATNAQCNAPSGTTIGTCAALYLPPPT